MKYRYGKYLHSPMIHAMYLELVVDYDILLKIEEGELEHTRNDTNIVDFCSFRDLLSNQMIKYNPTHCKYAGDANMRPATQQNQPKIDNRKDYSRGEMVRPLEEGVQLYNLAKPPKESKYRRGANSRLCGNITQLDMHLKCAETGDKHGNFCKVFGKVDYYKCSICGFYLYLMDNRDQPAGRTCFFDYHNDAFFCLARADAGLSKTKSKDWTYPSLAKNRENIRNINKMNSEIAQH